MDAFLSYARIDGAEVGGALREELESLGVSVWFDEVAIVPGKSQARQMDRGLQRARAGIAVLTPAYGAGASHKRGRLRGMTTWEYTTTVITHGFMGRQSDELDRGKFQEELSRLGADGWELATVFLGVNLHREKDGHVIVFKRRVD